MYETSGNEKCPVVSFEKYVANLKPDCQAFWQRPAFNFEETSTRWYDKVPVSKNVMYDKMKNLSIAAKLSTVYTNHCLSATCITVLDNSRFEARHIMTVSGQKSEASIRSCSRNVTDETKRNMTSALSTHMDIITPSEQATVGKDESEATNKHSHNYENSCQACNNFHINWYGLMSKLSSSAFTTL